MISTRNSLLAYSAPVLQIIITLLALNYLITG